jgi:dihydroxyacetone kinase-like protein
MVTSHGSAQVNTAETINTEAATMTLEDALAWTHRFIDQVKSAKASFTELDRRAGDGDFGTNIETAVLKAEQQLTERPPTTASEVLQRLSAGFLATGGTSGPLLGSWFRALARSTVAGATTQALADGVDAATAAVQRLGKAALGDRTMVDAMVPASAALREAAEANLELPDALRKAADAARRGAAATSTMLARKGRASYIGDAAQGMPDPGAVLVADFFEAVT